MRSRMPRAGLSFLVALGLVLTMTAPAFAAVPANDTYAGRETIAGLPFSATVDTTEATTDADDVEWNASCGAPATDASIWYSFTASTETGVLVDTTGSDYSTGIAAVTGSPGSFETVACGPGAIGFFVAAGETVSIVVFDAQEDGSGNGGTLQLTVVAAPPPPTVEVTVDPVARFDSRTGSVTVTGTITCTGESIDNLIDVQLEQRVGRFIISGFGGTSFACDGTTETWSVEVFADNGIFKGGKAASVTFAMACGFFACGIDFEERIVRIRG
jgi:hypothetical protein